MNEWVERYEPLFTEKDGEPSLNNFVCNYEIYVIHKNKGNVERIYPKYVTLENEQRKRTLFKIKIPLAIALFAIACIFSSLFFELNGALVAILLLGFSFFPIIEMVIGFKKQFYSRETPPLDKVQSCEYAKKVFDPENHQEIYILQNCWYEDLSDSVKIWKNGYWL